MGLEVFLGESGLKESQQDPFSTTVRCSHCGGEARIVFVACENEGKEVSNLRENGGRGDYWFHDSIAAAVYSCRDCFEATARINQS